MRKLLIAAVMATSCATVIAAPTGAEARRGAYAAGIIGGLSAGAIIGNAAYPYYGYGYYPGYPAPVYASPATFGPPPGCVIRRQRVFDGHAWRWQKLRVCH